MNQGPERTGNTNSRTMRDFWKKGQVTSLLNVLQFRAWDTERHKPDEIKRIIETNQALRQTWSALHKRSWESRCAGGPGLIDNVATIEHPGEFSTPATIDAIDKQRANEAGITIPVKVENLYYICDNAEGPFFYLLEMTPQTIEQTDGIVISYLFSSDKDEENQFLTLSALAPNYVPRGYTSFSAHKLYFEKDTADAWISDEMPTQEEAEMVARLAEELRQSIEA